MNKHPIIFNTNYITNSPSDMTYGILSSPCWQYTVNYLWKMFNKDHGSMCPITLYEQAKNRHFLINKPHGLKGQMANFYSPLSLALILCKFDESN